MMVARRWIFLLALWCAVAESADVTVTHAQWRIVATAPTAARAEELLRLARQAQEALSECLGAPPPALSPLRFQIGDVPPSGNAGLVCLPAGISSEAILFRLHQAVVARWIQALRTGPNLEPATNTDWLAAALARRHVASVAGDFSTLAILLPRRPGDALPAVEKLCTLPVDPQWSATFELYCRYCDLLLTVLQSQDTKREGRLRRVLELQAVGRTAVTAMELAYADKLSGAQTLQNWYAREGLALLRYRHGRQLTADECLERLDGILAQRDTELAKPAAPASRSGTYPWERLLAQPVVTPGANETKSLPAIQVSAAQKEFFTLLQDCPLALRPELEPIGAALNQPTGDSPERYREALSSAVAAFRAACERHRLLTRYLDGLDATETSWNPATLALLRQLGHEQQQRIRQLDPLLATWLDAQEKATQASPRP